MATLDDSTLQAVNNANFKSVAEMAILDSQDHRRRMQVIAENGMARLQALSETSLAASIDRLNTTSVPEGLGISAAQRGDLAKQINDLSASVATMLTSIDAASKS